MIPGRIQCRDARALLNISQADLASLSGVNVFAIAAFEDGIVALKLLDREAIRRAFEAQGLRFTDDGDVRLA